MVKGRDWVGKAELAANVMYRSTVQILSLPAFKTCCFYNHTLTMAEVPANLFLLRFASKTDPLCSYTHSLPHPQTTPWA